VSALALARRWIGRLRHESLSITADSRRERWALKPAKPIQAVPTMSTTPSPDSKFYGIRYAFSYLQQARQAGLDDLDMNDQLAFLSLLAQSRGKYLSQLGQDILALCMSGFKRNGYFVEVGAHHGTSLSNTALLESGFEWTGLLIEPNPKHIASLKARRAKHVAKAAWNKSGETLVFHATEDSALSNLAAATPNDQHKRTKFDKLEVQTMTLDDILSSEGAPADIDFMSIDIEGAELTVLEGLDLDRWNIKVMTLEHNHDPQRIEQFTSLLAPNGFRRVFDAVADFDCYFVKEACLETWRKTYRSEVPFLASK
jgi:FkbM family methyltransferase